MATTALRSMVVTRPGGAEGAPAAVGGTTQLPDLAHVVGYRPLIDRGFGEPKTRLEGPQGLETPISQESEVTKEFRQELLELAHKKLEKLITERSERSPEEFDRWLTDSLHASDMDWFYKYTKEKAGAGTFRQVDEAKLTEFMNTDAGLAYIVNMEARDAEEARMADAVVVALGPESPAPSVIDETVHEVQGSGLFRRGARRVDHWARTRSGRPGGRGLERDQTRGLERVQRFFLDTRGRITATVTGSTAGAAAGGFFVGQALIPIPGVGGAIGAAAGALTSLAVAGGFRLSRRGETTGIEISPRELQYILNQNNATIEWSKAMNNIDPLDMEIVNNTVRMRQGGHAAETPVNNRDRAARHEARALRLKRYQERLGVRNEYQDVDTMRWLIEGSIVPPRTGDPFLERVMREFDPNNEMRLDGNGGGIRDVNGNSFWRRGRPLGAPGTAYAGRVPPVGWAGPTVPGNRERNPNFDQNNLDIDANVDRWRHAYDAVLRRDLNNIGMDILRSKTDYRSDLLALIKQKKKDAKEGGTRRKQELSRTDAALTEDEKGLGAAGESKKLGDFRTAVTKLRAEIDAVVSGINVGGVVVDSLEDASRTLAGLLDGTIRGPVTIDGQVIGRSIDRQTRRLERDIAAEVDAHRVNTVDRIQTTVTDYTTLTVEPQRRLVTGMRPTDPLRAAAERQLASMEERLAGLEEQLATAQNNMDAAEDRIRGRRTFQSRLEAIQRQEQLIREKQAAIVAQQKKLQEVTTGNNTGRNDAEKVVRDLSSGFDRVVARAIPGLAAANLETDTFDVLVARLPADERYDKDSRLLLLNAMVEARARAAEPRIMAPTSRINDVIAAGGIQEIDLYLLSPQEMVSLSTSRGVPVGGITLAEATAVKTEAVIRFNARQTALTAMHRDVQTMLRMTKAEAANLGERGVETPQLDAIERMITRFDAIREGIENNEDIMDFLDGFLSITPLRRRGVAGPAGAGTYAFADYERPDAAPTADDIEMKERIRRLISGHDTDAKVAYNDLHGAEAAHARNADFLTDNDLREILVNGLNLGGTIPGRPVGAPGSRYAGVVPPVGWRGPVVPGPRVQIPMDNLTIVGRLLRMGVQLQDVPPGLEVNRTLIAPNEIGRCLSQSLFEHLTRMVQRY